MITPTDPVVASSVVTGDVAERNLPERLRHAISAESGFNDGLAYPFVLLPILLLSWPPGEALTHWLVHTILLEVGIAVVLGALAGYATGKVLLLAEARETTEHASILTVGLALALTTLGDAPRGPTSLPWPALLPGGSPTPMARRTSSSGPWARTSWG